MRYGVQTSLGDTIGFGQGETHEQDPTCEGRFKTTRHTAWRGASQMQRQDKLSLLCLTPFSGNISDLAFESPTLSDSFLV